MIIEQEEKLPWYLEPNARCPICKKFFHNIDVYNNPIPKLGPKRKAEELCQCPKGVWARKQRKEFRNVKEKEIRAKEKRAKEALSLRAKNKQFWLRVRHAPRRIREGGALTAGIAGESNEQQEEL